MRTQRHVLQPSSASVRVLRLGGRALSGLLAFAGLTALLAGLPVALVHFVGWPLPDHLPTGDEAHALLLNPMSAQVLLDTLACLCWIMWFFFALDVMRCTRQAVRSIRWPDVHSVEPLTGLAATLVGTIVVTLLTGRAHAVPTTISSRVNADLTQVAVSAPLRPGPARPVAAHHGDPLVNPAPSGMVQVVDEVRAPHNGIHDSLWRVAERLLHDGDRWPELYQLNRGVVQPDGRALDVPHLVHPGWRILANVPAPVPPIAAQEPPSTTTAPPHSSAPETQHTTTPSPEPGGTSPESDDGTAAVDLGNGVFVSLALAGVVAAFWASICLSRRRRYQAGSGKRDDLNQPVASVVRALRLVHEHGEGHPAGAEPGSAQADMRNGRDIALDVASTRGLGLTGQGAAAAARAVVLHLATRRSRRVRVLVPAVDFDRFFPGVRSSDLPSAVTVVESLDAALDELEAALLTRTRHMIEDEVPSGTDPIVLLATPAPHVEGRLQAVLDTGSALGLAGVLLGHWRAGATVRVRLDGTVGTTSAGRSDALAGTRLFTLPANDAAELLSLLREAEDAAEPEPPACPPADTPQPVDEPNGDSGVHAGHEPPEVDLVTRPPLTLRVFGAVELSLHEGGGVRELRSVLTPKQCEVLVFLALHPQGARREALNEAVWPDSRPPRPFNSMHNALSLLRRALDRATDGAFADLILNDGGRYRLNPVLVSTDYDQLHRDLQVSRDTDDSSTALRRAVDLYQADLAEDLTALWVEPFRESLRRDMLDAIAAFARRHDVGDPAIVLALLERAREIDRYNEIIYCDIIRAQARLGQFAAIPRTLKLLTATLGEIGQEPTDNTVKLATSLLRRGD